LHCFDYPTEGSYVKLVTYERQPSFS